MLVGGAVLVGVMWLLDLAGAPWWVVALAWVAPTAVVVTWSSTAPRPAVPTDSDDDSWTGFSIQYGLVGERTPRPLPARLVVGVLFGAPVAWSILVIGLGAVAGMSG